MNSKYKVIIGISICFIFVLMYSQFKKEYALIDLSDLSTLTFQNDYDVMIQRDDRLSDNAKENLKDMIETYYNRIATHGELREPNLKLLNRKIYRDRNKITILSNYRELNILNDNILILLVYEVDGEEVKEINSYKIFSKF